MFGVKKLLKSLFIKDRNLHLSCQIYKGTSGCGETYVGETIRNVEECWLEHNFLAINQNQPNILLIMKNTTSCGVF